MNERTRRDGDHLLDVLQDAIWRLEVILEEIELGEVGIGYMVAGDLRDDLENAVAQARERSVSVLREIA